MHRTPVQSGVIEQNPPEDQALWIEKIVEMLETRLDFERWENCPDESQFSVAQTSWWKSKHLGWQIVTRLARRKYAALCMIVS